MRWHYRDTLLVSLFPVAFAFHIIEEWVGGFPEWVALVAGGELPRTAFISINGTAMAVMLVGVRATIANEKNGWVGIAIATVLLVNGFAHIAGSLVTRSYSPGLFTGVVLYLPLAQLALIRAWLQSSRGLFARGLLVGLAAHALVLAVAYALVTD